MRPIRLVPGTVNHMLLSGPATIPPGTPFEFGSGNSVIAPLVDIRPIRLAPVLQTI